MKSKRGLIGHTALSRSNEAFLAIDNECSWMMTFE